MCEISVLHHNIKGEVTQVGIRCKTCLVGSPTWKFFFLWKFMLKQWIHK